jgi:hypothetical protein
MQAMANGGGGAPSRLVVRLRRGRCRRTGTGQQPTLLASVTGAVSMVEMALRDLSAKQVVALDDERRAAMVSDLMTVLCAESEVRPVINTGTLYNG